MYLVRSLPVLTLIVLPACMEPQAPQEPGSPSSVPSTPNSVPSPPSEAPTAPPSNPPREAPPTQSGPSAAPSASSPAQLAPTPSSTPAVGQLPSEAMPVELPRTARLKKLESCSNVEGTMRAAALRGMRGLMKSQREKVVSALEQGLCTTPASIFGATAGNAGMSGAFAGDSVALGAAPAPSAPQNVSETNNQVAGVDEADLVKNDDHYIYAIADEALQIIEAWPPENTRVLARVSFDGTPKRLLTVENRLVVFSSVAKSAPEAQSAWYYPRNVECTYGYDCDFVGDGSSTRISIFDITDRAAPKALRTIDTPATFLSARRIGSAIHTALYEQSAFLRTLPAVPKELVEARSLCSGDRAYTFQLGTPAPAEDIERAKRAFDALEAANLAAIEAAPLETLYSGMSDSLAPNASPLGDCSSYYDSPLADGTGFLTLASFDLTADAPLTWSTIVSRPGASYASKDAYYVSVRQKREPSFGWWYPSFDAVEEASTVHKFTLSGATNAYAASGVVAGRVLNQFSMDEHAGHLRIATTSGRLPSPDVSSALQVLEQNGDALELRGALQGLAPGEDIRSVRFLGERGYIVTFKKTDPLFAFDLSDPKAPRLTGELKIPGFSTYMHPLDAGHLLTIGYDAADQGDFAFFTGLLLQVFDVTDAANPLLTSKVVIGTRGSSSEAATNHLAFNYFAPHSTLAIPITVCEGGTDTGSYGTMTFSGVQLYNVTPATGFSLTGQVSHPYVDPGNPQTYYVGGACSSWWSRANTIVKRTLFMDDFMYSLSDARLKVNDLRDLSRDVADVPLQAEQPSSSQ